MQSSGRSAAGEPHLRRSCVTATRRTIPAFLIVFTTTRRTIPTFLIPFTTSSAAYSKLRVEQAWSWSRVGSAFQSGMVFGLETFAKACSRNAQGKYTALVKWHAQDGNEDYQTLHLRYFSVLYEPSVTLGKLYNVRGWSPGIGRAWSIDFNFGIKSLVSVDGPTSMYICHHCLFSGCPQ